jgi:coxsackievirus/adenovirus receptor
MWKRNSTVGRLSRRFPSLTLAVLAAPVLLGARGCGGDDDPDHRGDGDDPDRCVCTELYAPVCGADGRTYGNACEAECGGVDVAYEGSCRPDCSCATIYAPVCGADGRTYGNACEAGCAGVEVVGEGPCECPPIVGVECEWGHVIDERGCPTPECSPPPECEPVACALFCEHGFAVDERGCEICACNPEPSRCWSDDDCGPGAYCVPSDDCFEPWEGASGGGSGSSGGGDGSGGGSGSSGGGDGSGGGSGSSGGGDGSGGGGDWAPPGRPVPRCPGICVPGEPPPPPRRCHSDADCAPGERCELPVCILESDPPIPCPEVGWCVSDEGASSKRQQVADLGAEIPPR